MSRVRYSADVKTEVVKLYENGAKCREIVKRFGITRNSLFLWLKAAGVRTQADYTDAQLKEISELYRAGFPATKIATKVNLPQSVVYRLLHKLGVEFRPLHESKRTKSINHEAFSVLSDEAAYWVGFLLADGCVYQNDVQIGLQAGDHEHLRKFLSFIEADYPVRFKDQVSFGTLTRSCSVQVTSQRMTVDLMTLGIVPRKSTREVASPLVEKDPNFWRGFIDGDGFVSAKGPSYPYPVIGVVGSEKVCQQFLDFVSTISPGVRAVRPMHGIFSASVKGAGAEKLAEVLYGNAPTYSLERKHSAAEQMLKERDRRLTAPVLKKVLTAEHCENMRNARLGWRPSDEQRARMSEGQRLRHANAPHPRLGSKHSDESKLRMSASRKKYLAQVSA